jgi:uncharacterized protein (TIGR03083 family)
MTISAQEIAPITPARVADVATAELDASLALLGGLEDRDWTAPTDCAGWSVHDMTAHLVGQYQGLASVGLYLRRHRQAHRRYPSLSRLDADNRLQIDELGGHSGPELTAMLAAIGPRAIRARRRLPGLIRRQHIVWMYPEETLPDDRLSYLMDVLALRDPWMHRVDIARASGLELLLGAHDRVIVGQVITDLDRAWQGPPAVLELTGPAGGRWTLGSGNPAGTIQADAVDYMRALSGRADLAGLHADGDPEVATAAAAVQVIF